MACGGSGNMADVSAVDFPSGPLPDATWCLNDQHVWALIQHPETGERITRCFQCGIGAPHHGGAGGGLDVTCIPSGAEGGEHTAALRVEAVAPSSTPSPAATPAGQAINSVLVNEWRCAMCGFKAVGPDAMTRGSQHYLAVHGTGGTNATNALPLASESSREAATPAALPCVKCGGLAACWCDQRTESVSPAPSEPAPECACVSVTFEDGSKGASTHGCPIHPSPRFEDEPERPRTIEGWQRHYEGLEAEVARLKDDEHKEWRRANRAETEVARLTAAIRWALGENGLFRERNDLTEGPFWWRKELRKRSGLV